MILVIGLHSYAQSSLLQENQQIAQRSAQLLSLYDLETHQSWRDITAEVYQQSTTSDDVKQAILEDQRRIVLFRYPSDGVQVKALISFTPQAAHQPLIILLRGGNRHFGLLNPGSEWLACGDNVIVSSALRGGVSEGVDEFGGADVNDIENMVNYLPVLAAQLHFNYSPSEINMLGMSRGGLEMFLALSRSYQLQKNVKKVVALSAILDLQEQIKQRPEDMEKMFIEDFGLVKGVNDVSWIASRNPLNTVSSLPQNLAILIVQGTDDPRVQPTEAHRMVNRLLQNQHTVTYWEIKEGQHLLTNRPTIKAEIFQWLESHPC